MVTQHFALVRPMTVLENVLLSSAGLGPPTPRAPGAGSPRRPSCSGSTSTPTSASRTSRSANSSGSRSPRRSTRAPGCSSSTSRRRCWSPGRPRALRGSAAAHRLRSWGALHQPQAPRGRRDQPPGLGAASGPDRRHPPHRQLHPAELAELMVGRSVAAVLRDERRVGPGPSNDEAVVIAVEHVSLDGSTGKRLLDDVDLRVHRGEILAIAGVSGNGQRELADIPPGCVCRPAATCASAVRTSPARHRRRSWRAGSGGSRGPARQRRRRPLGRGEPRPGGPRTVPARALPRQAGHPAPSRGAHRPVRHQGGADRPHRRPLRREHAEGPPGSGPREGPRAILVAQPTRGLDVGAGEYVHQQLLARRADGAAILLISGTSTRSSPSPTGSR